MVAVEVVNQTVVKPVNPAMHGTLFAARGGMLRDRRGAELS